MHCSQPARSSRRAPRGRLKNAGRTANPADPCPPLPRPSAGSGIHAERRSRGQRRNIQKLPAFVRGFPSGRRIRTGRAATTESTLAENTWVTSNVDGPFSADGFHGSAAASAAPYPPYQIAHPTPRSYHPSTSNKCSWPAAPTQPAAEFLLTLDCRD